tara:strand:+ start:2985 stop:3929 length:945 start_codon:yes stop_codon:yes gene_type:complete
MGGLPYNEALKRRGSLTIWFDPEMSWDAVPTGRRGRQQTYSDAAIQTDVPFDEGSVQHGAPADDRVRREPAAAGWPRLVGARLQHAVPPSEDPGRQHPLPWVEGPAAPAHPLSGHCCAIPCRAVDSTGIKVEGEGEWHARKHGGPKRRVWRKIHLGIDEETLEIRAVEITGSHIGDAPVLPDLLGQIPADQEIGSVTADGAYDTRKCHDAIADRGAHAVIPPRKNAKPWKTVTAGAVARNEALRASRYLGRALWRRWSGYHRRSRVETKMHCVKLLGQRLMARDFDRQVAEIQVRIAVLNGYTALGIPVTEAVG